MESLELSEDQQQALNQLVDWLKNPNKKQFVTLGGYAGTGKTTLIAAFKKELLKSVKDKKTQSVKIAFCSYTGRATQNLKNKLKESSALSSKDTISTIHGLIYNPIENSNQEIIGWEKKDTLEYDLIVIDEASMVDEVIWRDLLSYKIPIIAIGDHGQLAPIKSSFNLMEKPEIALTQIHRQARDNPIIRVSELIRTNGQLTPDVFSASVIKFSTQDDTQVEMSELLENYTTDTLILCGFNSTRVKLNQHIRSNLGFESAKPQRNDRVICLRNNHKKSIYNGMLGTIITVNSIDKDWLEAEIKMDETDKLYVGLIFAPQFGSINPINFTDARKKAVKGDLFDFGYALTVHKAQGSQAKKVVLFEERSKHMTQETWTRWLYTGVTRAIEELYIFGH